MRIAFAGTPEFALKPFLALRSLDIDLCAVYTQPDRPAGRGRELKASVIKQAALDAGIRVYQPPSLKVPEAQAELAALSLDLLVVVAYGLILPQAVLDMPHFGCWNVHASLLPRWRGAAPIQRAIQAGDVQTGVALMQMDAGLDTGPVIDELAVALDPDWNAQTLSERLSTLGAELLHKRVAALANGARPHAKAQAETGVSYARKLLKEEAQLDFNEPAQALKRKIKAFNPSPVCVAQLGAISLKIFDAEALPGPSLQLPGCVWIADNELFVQTGDGVLRLLEVQRAGGKRMKVKDFLNANPSF